MQTGGGSSAHSEQHRFAGYTLDMGQGRLWAANGDIHLRPKTFALLAYMVRNSGRVLSKNELFDAVWPDVTVSDESLSQCVHALRDALGTDGASLVRTVPRRGYMFFLPVAASAMSSEAAGGVSEDDRSIRSSRRCSVAVLPFDAGQLASPDDRLWFDGVANDVISQLARLRSFDVIARGSSFALRGMASDGRRAGKRLGADYLVAGSVMQHTLGFLLRIDLVRTDTGAIVWTNEIEMHRAGFLGLVGTLVDRITASVQSQVTAAERDSARLVPDQSLTAWQAYHRGLEDFAIYTGPTLMRARAYFERATELDPGFVRAFAHLSECHATLSRSPFCNDRQGEAAASLKKAERAMQLDEATPSAQFAYAHARWLLGSSDIAINHARRSVEISPSFAEGHAEIGFYESLYGDPQRAFASLERAELLNPISPFIDSVHIDRALAHLQVNELSEAALWTKKAINRPDSYPQMQFTGAIILAAAGRLDAARSITDTLRRENAVFDRNKIFRPPYSVGGPAAEMLRRASADLGYD